MALRLLHGVLRRPSSKPLYFAVDHGDGGPAAEFSMTQSPTDAGCVLLRLSGDIDLICRDSLRNRLIAMIDIDQVDHLLVDLGGVTFLDCSGIGRLSPAATPHWPPDAATRCAARAAASARYCGSAESTWRWVSTPLHR